MCPLLSRQIREYLPSVPLSRLSGRTIHRCSEVSGFQTRNIWVVLRAIQFTCTPLRVLMRAAQRGVRCAKLAQRSQAKVSNHVRCVAQVT